MRRERAMSQAVGLSVGVIGGVVFSVALAISATLGTMAGMERDSNVYDTPSQTLAPWSLALVVIVGIAWVTAVVKTARKHR